MIRGRKSRKQFRSQLPTAEPEAPGRARGTRFVAPPEAVALLPAGRARRGARAAEDRGARPRTVVRFFAPPPFAGAVIRSLRALAAPVEDRAPRGRFLQQHDPSALFITGCRIWAAPTILAEPPEPPPELPPFADQDTFLAGIVCGMAVSEVGIGNMALTLIGEEPVNSFTEDNKPARFLCQHYENVRDFVLRKHCWSCATRRVELAQLSEAPTWGHAFQYALPADFLRLVEIEDHKGDYAIEDGKILTDEGTMRIVYVYRLTDVRKMDSLLQEAIAAMLAAELAIAIAQNRDLMKDMFSIYRQKLDEAKMIDAIEGPIETVTVTDWIEARLGGEA